MTTRYFCTWNLENDVEADVDVAVEDVEDEVSQIFQCNGLQISEQSFQGVLIEDIHATCQSVIFI